MNKDIRMKLEQCIKLKAVSSPSHAMLIDMAEDINPSGVHVFKNPIDKQISLTARENKTVDVVFLLRFNVLKGIEYINEVLMSLPANYDVVLAGRQDVKFLLDPRVECNVKIIEHIDGDEKFETYSKC